MVFAVHEKEMIFISVQRKATDSVSVSEWNVAKKEDDDFPERCRIPYWSHKLGKNIVMNMVTQNST